MAAALAYLIRPGAILASRNPLPTDYLRVDARPVRRRTVCRRDGLLLDVVGMAAIMTAVQPFLVHRTHHKLEPWNFVATAQCYGGTFQQFTSG